MGLRFSDFFSVYFNLTSCISDSKGRVREWLNRPVSKTGVASGLPWVRIPPLPLPVDMDITKTLYVSRRSDWRAWLRKHHEHATEIWLIYYKKNSGKPRIPYSDAVDEALSFGRIDSIIKPNDDSKYAQRFTPRKPRSPWSPANKERVRRLIRARKMSPAGLRAFKAGTRNTPTTRRFTIPSDILSALQANSRAWRHFRTFSRPYQRVRIGWIDGARKRPEVFRQRLRYFLAMTERGKKFGLVR